MAAVPSIGRAGRVDSSVPPEAAATQSLYERYANQIFGYCLHQLGSREEAEDAVQSTFLNAFRGLRRGVVPEQESAWLFKIAHNVCLSRRRSSWRRGRVESATDFEVVEELTPAPATRADELMGLQGVLEQMPDTQRRAILLREWQGLSYREIAEELELSQSAVETLIFRGRRALAQGLEQPPEPARVSWRRRVRTSANIGGLFAWAKSLLVGATAVKVAGTAAVVAVSSIAATAPLERHSRHATSGAPAAPKRLSPRQRSSTTKLSAPVLAAGTRLDRARTRAPERAPVSAPTRRPAQASRHAAATLHATNVAPPVVDAAAAPPLPPAEPQATTPPASAPSSPAAAEAAPAQPPHTQPPAATEAAQKSAQKDAKDERRSDPYTGDDNGNGKSKTVDHAKDEGGKARGDSGSTSASGRREKDNGNGNGKSNGKSKQEPSATAPPATATPAIPAPPSPLPPVDPPEAPKYQPVPQSSPRAAPTTTEPADPAGEAQAQGNGGGGGNGKNGEGGNSPDGGSKSKSK
jgi:RNA polymerase sigma factor (sigma-70 family)